MLIFLYDYNLERIYFFTFINFLTKSHTKIGGEKYLVLYIRQKFV